MDPILAAYVGATAALVATPGASTTVVVRNAVDGGWRAGLATAVGIAIANSTHAILTGAGVGLRVREHPAALWGLSVLGASYLAWLGVGSLRRAWVGARPAALLGRRQAAATTTAAAGFRDGLIVNLLNPAIMTFYLVVVPGFLPTPAPLSRFALYAAIHVTMALACHLLWSAIFDRVRRASGQTTVVRVLDLVAGIALIGLAVKTFLRF